MIAKDLETLATKKAVWLVAKKVYEAARVIEKAAWEAAEVVEREAKEAMKAADEVGLRAWNTTTAAWKAMDTAATEVEDAKGACAN